MNEGLKNRFFKMDKSILALFLLMVAVFLLMAVLEPKAFLKANNLRSMAFQFPEFGILSFGMMLAMISGGIDLSLVGVANFTSIVAVMIMTKLGGGSASIAAAVAASLCVGMLCGLLNGFLIGYLKIPAMLVTLCGLQLFTGLGMALTKGPALTGVPSAFLELANGSLFGIPYALILFILVAIVVAFIMRCTIYGQHLNLMGSNATASSYSGINNLKVTIITYMISSTLAAVSGLLIASHYGSAKSDYGTSYTLLALLVVVLGGTAPSGGKGKVLGVTLSILILQIISSAFNILRVNAFVKTFAWGLLLVVVMTIGALLRNNIIQIRRKNHEKINQQA